MVISDFKVFIVFVALGLPFPQVHLHVHCWGGGGGGGGGDQQASSLSSKHKLWNFHRYSLVPIIIILLGYLRRQLPLMRLCLKA